MWIIKLPIIQSYSPAMAAALCLQRLLGSDISRYVFVDFASGAGGPTPEMERVLNAKLSKTNATNVKFVLTDIQPHPAAWDQAAACSDGNYLSSIKEPIDATHFEISRYPQLKGYKLFRLFSLAFHHFDDALAQRTLRDTVLTSDGFW